MPELFTSNVTSLTSWKWSWGVTLSLETSRAANGCWRVGGMAAVAELGVASETEDVATKLLAAEEAASVVTRYLEGRLFFFCRHKVKNSARGIMIRMTTREE